MSLEFYTFLDDNKIPALADWREALRETGVPIAVAPEVNPLTAKGFCQMQVDEKDSGCEIASGLDDCEEILDMYPALTQVITPPKTVFTFRIGSDLRGLVCIFAIAASLVETSYAVFYDPQEDQIFTTKESLMAQAMEILMLSRELSE